MGPLSRWRTEARGPQGPAQSRADGVPARGPGAGVEEEEQEGAEEADTPDPGAAWPGLRNTAHLLPSHGPHVCVNVLPSTAPAPGPHALADEPRRLGPNKSD